MRLTRNQLPAKLVEARHRATMTKVRLGEIEQGRRYESFSQSRDDLVHMMVRRESGWVCSCEGHFYGQVCRHLGAVANRASREGWEFGEVSPTEGRGLPLEWEEVTSDPQDIPPAESVRDSESSSEGHPAPELHPAQGYQDDL